MKTYKDITGQRFGLLTAVEFSELRPTGQGTNVAYWKFQCDCGKVVVRRGTDVTRKPRVNAPPSCGCATKQSIYDSKSLGVQARFNEMYRRYTENASARNISFELPREVFESLIVQNCFYCNTKPNQLLKSASKYTRPEDQLLVNGIDRYNNSVGYTVENSVACCWVCNRMKLDIDGDIFIKTIKKILTNLNNKEVCSLGVQTI